jgi:hypothetical protein
MGEIFRASEEDWAKIESLSKEKFGYAYSGLCELRDRVAALEAARRAEVELLHAARAQQQQATTEDSSAAEPEPSDEELWNVQLEARRQVKPSVLWQTWLPKWDGNIALIAANRALFDVGVAWATARAEDPAAEPNDPAAAGFFPVEYADADGEGVRILMEPADETGRVCWAVRHSRHVNPFRKFPTPEAAYAAHRDAARAQQQAATEESSAAHSEPADPDAPQTLHDVALAHVDTLGRYFDILPAILDTIRRAIREPMAAPGGRVATDEELESAYDTAFAESGHGYKHEAGVRAVYNLGRQHAPACPHIRSSGDSNWCALAEQQAHTEPAPPAPAGGLVEEVMEAAEVTAVEAKWALDAVADWLEQRADTTGNGDLFADLLREEASR